MNLKLVDSRLAKFKSLDELETFQGGGRNDPYGSEPKTYTAPSTLIVSPQGAKRNMLKYFRESFRRKKARRVTQEYPAHIDTFNLKDEGSIEFSNWDNSLAKPITVTQANVDYFKQHINKGDLAIDIGAKIRDTTVLMALAAGKEGITIGFDPNPYVFRLLETNAGL